VLARICVGIGEAGGSPPAHSLVSDYFPLERRGRAMGLMAMGGSVGILISLLAGGQIAHHWGWRAAFLAMGVPGVVLAAVVRWTLREPPRGRFDAPGARGGPVPSLGETLSFLRRVPAFAHIALAGSLHSFAGYGAAAWNAAFLMRVHDFNVAQAGLRLGLLSAVAATISIVLGGYLGDWLGRRDVRWYQWMPALGALAHIPFGIAFLLWPAGEVAVWFLVPSALLGGLWAAPGHAMVQSLAHPAMRATASALMLLLFNLIGFGLGPWAVGALNDLLEPRLGEQAVRYSLLIIAITAAWGAAHNALAARTLERDLRAKDRG
jgi:MFS family permease